MSGRLFIDTWGWISLLNKREPHHKAVNAFYRRFRLQGGAIYTSDYVLDETITLLFKRVPGKSAAEALRVINTACLEGFVALVWMHPLLFEKTKRLRQKLQDKPDISFTDLTTMLIMKENGISEILTDDDHFRHVGMGFNLSL